MRIFIVLNLMLLNALATITGMCYLGEISPLLAMLAGIVGVNIACALFYFGLGK